MHACACVHACTWPFSFVCFSPIVLIYFFLSFLNLWFSSYLEINLDGTLKPILFSMTSPCTQLSKRHPGLEVF